MGIWVTAEGERIPFSELTDDHLVNIVHYLEKKAPELHKKALKRYEDLLAVEMDKAEDDNFWFASSTKRQRRLQMIKSKLNHIIIADPRNPCPYPGSSPYKKLVEMAKQRGLLPADYDWMTPIREQQRDMDKMAALSHHYGGFADIERRVMAHELGGHNHIHIYGRQQGKTSALEQAILDARVKMAELQANPPLMMDTGDSALRFVPHQGISPGDAIMFGGAFEGQTFFVGDVVGANGVKIRRAAFKLAPRSTTCKLRK